MALRDDLITALAAAQIPSPRLEAGIILQHAAPAYPEMSPQEEVVARAMLKRRLNHEPLDKIIGSREFYKYVFKVNNNVLSPRPDTEILLESALELIPSETPFRILDLGTGSGCILLSLLKERPAAVGVGLDISAAALDVAVENAAVLGVSARVKFINQSWNSADFGVEEFDIIVSNPPYIPAAEIPTLEREVREYDPLTALDGGKDGYKCYREIAAQAPLILQNGGYILLESGIGQAEKIMEIFAAAGLKPVKTVPDLAGINRCVILKK